MASNPKASSTPKTIKGRPPIRPSEILQSPIENTQSETSSDTEDRSTPEKESTFEQIEQRSTDYTVSYLVTVVVVLFLSVLYVYNPKESGAAGSVSTFEKLQKEFPSQEEDFWINIKVAIDDISNLNQPKSIIFLHKDERTMANVLKSVSDYASSEICVLSEPIVLSGTYLRKPEILKDYGTFITEMKTKFHEKCVMIIRDLDKVPGTSAQAFHSLCDEYNPVNVKVLYMFTLKVDSFPEKTNTFIEKRLREVWSDLHSDKFYPLYTRLSTVMLQVRSEY